MGNWCWVLVNFLFASLFPLQLIFLNLEKGLKPLIKNAQAPFFNFFHISDSFRIKQMPLFWNFEIFFSRKVLNIKHFLVLNVSRNFSLVCSLHCHIVSVANDKNCHKTVSLGRDCVEALGKSSLILNSPQTYFWKEKIISFF